MKATRYSRVAFAYLKDSTAVRSSRLRLGQRGDAGRTCRGLRRLFVSLRIALRAQNAFLHDALDLEQRLVLDLADALLGHADDLADLLERQRGRLRLLPVEAATDDGLLDVRELGQVAIDDLLELIHAILFDDVAATVVPVALFHLRLKFDREMGLVMAGLHGRAAEGLQNRPARVRAELEALVDIELIDSPHEGHVAFADDLSEVHVAEARPLGHRQDQ